MSEDRWKLGAWDERVVEAIEELEERVKKLGDRVKNLEEERDLEFMWGDKVMTRLGPNTDEV